MMALAPCCSRHGLTRQTTFAKLFADIGTQEDVRQADLATLLAAGPPPARVTAQHVQALRRDLRAETLSHAAGLTAHTAIAQFGSSSFLGRDENQWRAFSAPTRTKSAIGLH